jgi:hypothetical protein
MMLSTDLIFWGENPLNFGRTFFCVSGGNILGNPPPGYVRYMVCLMVGEILLLLLFVDDGYLSDGIVF